MTRTPETRRAGPGGPGELIVELEGALRPLPVGRAAAYLCVGTCFHPESEITSLELSVAGERHPVEAFGMVRPNSPHQRSGFWTTFPAVAPSAPGRVELVLYAGLADGRTATARVGEIEVVAEPQRLQAPLSAGGDLVAICMATYNPDPELFRRQVNSLREQTHSNWFCVISDDASDPEALAAIEREIGGDERFLVSRSPDRLGFYRNFERALNLAPADARYIALCDQDDVWYPDKVEVLIAALEERGAQLAYSDQRLVTADGGLISETFWGGRRNNFENLTSMLVANTVTGAAMLIRREAAEAALPFPDQPGWQFHDHWLALVGLARGRLAYVDRPLYDYVQHPKAILGQVAVDPEGASERGTRRSLRLPRPRAAARELLGGGRAAYFCGYMRLKVQALTLLLRSSDELTPAKRRALQRFANAESSTAPTLLLAARPLRGLIGRNETLGSEKDLVKGILWRRTIAWRSRRDLSAEATFRADSSVPPCGPDSYGQRRLRRWRRET